MISKKSRLNRYQVQKILKKGHSKKLGLFTIRFFTNKITHNRWATVLSTKFEKSAVKRNQKKRQIFEAIRLITKELEDTNNQQQHYDLILIPYKQILSFKYDKIHQNINEIFEFIAKKQASTSPKSN